MSWFTKTLSSTIGKKLIMALTGLFLILFLIIHLAGNLQLLIDDGGKTFNIYAHKMASNPLIKIVSIGNFVFILLHIVVSAILTRDNRKARPVRYAANKPSANSKWASRNMGILGTLVLAFLIVHLKSFWYENKFGDIQTVVYEKVGRINDLYAVISSAYEQWWYVLFYVICMGFVGFHLSHGFQSAFRTLGLDHKKYTPLIEKTGYAFSIIVPALFALIPVWMFFSS